MVSQGFNTLKYLFTHVTLMFLLQWLLNMSADKMLSQSIFCCKSSFTNIAEKVFLVNFLFLAVH